jgi:putative DNA primase/helicase
MRERRREAEEITEPKVRDPMIKASLAGEALGRANAMLAYAASETLLKDTGEGWDADPYLLGVMNGVVELKTGKLRAGKKEDRISRVCPIEYSETMEIPKLWTGFVDTVLQGDLELIDWTQRAVGYSMTGSTTEKMMFFCYGHQGNNGKSTFVETVGEVMGGYAWRKFPMSELMERKNTTAPSPNLAKLPGVRYVTTTEIGEGKRINEELIKDLTGGIDTINARDMYAKPFLFKPQFKLWMHGNYKPLIKGVDNAIWERVGLIPFLVTIPPEKRDRQLEGKLREVLPGILGWMIQGVKRWLDKGLALPDCMKEEVQSYRDEMNPLREFVEECVKSGPGFRIRTTELYDVYKGWKIDRKEQRYVLGSTTFAERMESMGFERKRFEDGRFWVGIRSKSDTFGDNLADGFSVRIP